MFWRGRGGADIHAQGFIDKACWTWLKRELADGDAANQLMIIATRIIPIGIEPSEPTSEMSWWLAPQNAVTIESLLGELHSHIATSLAMPRHPGPGYDPLVHRLCLRMPADRHSPHADGMRCAMTGASSSSSAGSCRATSRSI